MLDSSELVIDERAGETKWYDQVSALIKTDKGGSPRTKKEGEGAREKERGKGI